MGELGRSQVCFGNEKKGRRGGKGKLRRRSCFDCHGKKELLQDFSNDDVAKHSNFHGPTECNQSRNVLYWCITNRPLPSPSNTISFFPPLVIFLNVKMLFFSFSCFSTGLNWNLENWKKAETFIIRVRHNLFVFVD